jgi:2',3'-cyclic-nucleotide 2'-phosphodiesterase (5'-nucleotidase family)
MRHSRYPALFALLVLSLLLAAPVPALLSAGVARAQDASPVAANDAGAPVLLFAAPGLQPDLVTRFAGEGALPALSSMMAAGASADGGLLPPFPATVGTELTTLLTGAWPAESGIVADRFYRTGSPSFDDHVTWSDAGLLQADTLPQAAERASKQVVAVGWEGLSGLDPALQGPVVGAATTYSEAGIVTTAASRDEGASSAVERVDLRPAEGWKGAPESYSPAQETSFTIPSLDPAGVNPDRTFAVYIADTTDDATTNYDQIMLATEKQSASEVARLGGGAWASVPVTLAGNLEGQSAGFQVKALELAPDLSAFRLYVTPVSRYTATWTACGDRPACSEPGGFEEFVNKRLGPAVPIDAAPVEAGLIDAETFSEQGITAAWQGIDALRLIVNDLGVRPDLLLLGSAFPGETARVLPGQLDGAIGVGGATPVATPLAGSDTGEVARGLLRESYRMADQLLATGQELLGAEATALVVSPGGIAVSSRAVNAGQVLVDAGLAEAAQPANCVPGPVTAPPGTPDPEALPVGPGVKACWSGGSALIFLNLDGREAAGAIAEDAYDATREAVAAAFRELRDPDNPDTTVVSRVLMKEELRDVGGADALHPSRGGDLVVTLAPPYRFDDTTGGAAFASAIGMASRGYAADSGASSGFFLASGPAIAGKARIAGRAIDVAPTAAFLLRVPGPHNASGNILFAALANGSSLRDITFLDISDFHGQLPPLSALADTIDADGAVNSSYDVGGVAVLAPWFGRFRDAASGPVLLVTAGDAVGATPPISSAFGDRPTIEAMNAIGFVADSLGNHNFDAGAEYMFGTLEPLADFPYLSSNLVPARADATPAAGTAPFLPSLLLDLGGVKLGLVGFSNPDIPQLTKPGALGPWRVIDPVEPVNREAASLREQGVTAVVAMGHMGATGGTLTVPTGPVVEMAGQLQGVDVVIGDHTDVQVAATLPNGILFTENRSKGVMFTRVQLVIDSATGDLVYRTADFHRPWVIGMTPDAAMVARLDALQAELAPTLAKVIGAGAIPIPRADSCGMETGRTCESLIGDVIADALRLTYSTDFALTNSGGIRADLTCPPEGGDFCPEDAETHAITEGQVLTVLPFGNVAVTLEVTGAELKEMLETGVSRMPEASGAFPQVSGLCFTYDLDAPAGSRVTSAVRQADDGSCSGEAIDFSESARYTIATNDFTASGGDGYPDLISRANTRDILASVVSAYIAGQSPLALPGETLHPTLEGRIVCKGEGCPAPVGE